MSRVSAQKESGKFALQLVENRGEEPRVDSRAIAQALGVVHRHTLKLIKTYLPQFETLGKVSFENAPSGRGQATTIVLLTESQCTFLMALSRNTDQVVALKLKLTTLFEKYKRAYLKTATERERRGSLEWQAVRAEVKETRKQCMGTVADLMLPYAREQGSEHPGEYFRSFSKLTNSRLGIEPPASGPTRDALDADTLRAVQQVELVEAAAIIEGISSKLPYKEVYQLAKARVEALNVIKLVPVERKALPPGPQEGDLFSGVE